MAAPAPDEAVPEVHDLMAARRAVGKYVARVH
jgi:hypothetical protein